MATAEKSAAVEVAPRDPRQVLRIHSAVGALYVLASLWLIFLGLPSLWRLIDVSTLFTEKPNEFLADALLLLVTVPAIFGLFVLGRYLEGPNPVHGLRAATTYLVLVVLGCGLLITSGVNLVTVIGLVLLAGAVVLFFQPGFLDWLVRCEDQGWFHVASFKPNQGVRVRRATVAGVMVLVLCGIYTLIVHRSLQTGNLYQVARPFAADSWSPSPNPWVVTMPFSTEQLVFLYNIPLTVPFILLVVSGWLAWRLVNWPAFADFLIATEAEMNKVSWTSRKRLYQDTIVVLTTVVLFTLFLFVIDILWIKILTSPLIDVLKHDPTAAARRNQQSAQW
jgi:preprotein translocase SecE subunit